GYIHWLAPTQTIVAGLGTSSVLVTTTQVAATGVMVWLAPTQTIVVSGTISGTVSLLGPTYVTTQASATAEVVWLAPTQTIIVTVSGTILQSSQVATSGVLVWLAPTQTIVMSGMLVTASQIA